MAANIEVAGDTLSVHFKTFGMEDYQLFLKLKSMPEHEISFLPEDESYRLAVPARFAHLLGVETNQRANERLPLNKHLFDDQAAVVEMALAAKRFAIWSNCGLGKTLCQLEWARQVAHRTGGRVLIFTLNGIVSEFLRESAKFYGNELALRRLHSRDEMREWCAAGPEQIAITNYEKLNPQGGDQVVPEIRQLAGVAADESSRLKGGGGVQKWAMIHSTKGVEYKLSSTATPAPNDTIEYASQASFLEKMRSEGEIIWSYFWKDPNTGEWTVRRHARQAFFEWMASWSIYIRDPRSYGWRTWYTPPPEPETFTWEIDPTEDQIEFLRSSSRDKRGQLSLFDTKGRSAVARLKLSQAAKGFVYLSAAKGTWRPVASLKPAFTARLIQGELERGLQVLVWTEFDAETDILSRELADAGIQHAILVGKTGDEEREAILESYRDGETTVLLTRASVIGYGVNLQNVGSMVFHGWDDSYEAYYQALCRAYRFGQTKKLRVHFPLVTLLEGDMLENLLTKADRHRSEGTEMEASYVEAVKRFRQGSPVHSEIA